MTTSISVDNVSVTFGNPGGKYEVVAVDRVSFDVRRGEFFSLIGPSGCGKSTILSLIGGLLKPTAGTVCIDGEPVTRPPYEKAAMVFQQYTLLPWRTILENVEIPLEFRGVDLKRRRGVALDYLGMVGLSDFRNFYPRQLSGGMRQRVAIARALSVNPRILLMDEPFGALDEQTRVVLGEELMRILEKTKKTIVFVTHSIAEAIYLSDRIAVMTARPGKIKTLVDIDLPHPRDPGMMTSALFNQYREAIFSSLHEESLKVASQSMRAAKERMGEG